MRFCDQDKVFHTVGWGALLVALLLVVPARAQQKYWVFFADKAGVQFQPRQYFHPHAIARRQREGIPLDHFTDRPVRTDYLKQVGGLVDTVRHASRWFNAVAVWAHPKQIRQVAALPFVMATEAMPVQQATLSQVPAVPPAGADILTNLIIGQTARLGGEHFDSLNVDGSGVRVAIFDAGFPGTNTHPALQHVRLRSGIKQTYDFVRDRTDVYRANSHGTSVMSNIAGIRNGHKMGLATGADFLLARTETGWHERISEEENWVAALEWADRHGAEVVNSSLGYTNARYFPRDMNGRKSLIARAANMAAAKGMVVVNSAGNEGNNPWKVIGSPADADSILSVGGLAPWSDSHIGFSSYGPTADKRLKPNVCAYGRAAVAGKKGYKQAYGTSFASPLVAGFVACARQLQPDLPCMQLMREVERSGDLYPYFDYAHGYGVPQANRFMVEQPEPEATFDLEQEGNTVTITIREAYFESSAPDKPTGVPGRKYHLYYHVLDAEGHLSRYAVVQVDQREVLELKPAQWERAKALVIHYKGFTQHYTLKR